MTLCDSVCVSGKNDKCVWDEMKVLLTAGIFMKAKMQFKLIDISWWDVLLMLCQRDSWTYSVLTWTQLIIQRRKAENWQVIRFTILLLLSMRRNTLKNDMTFESIIQWKTWQTYAYSIYRLYFITNIPGFLYCKDENSCTSQYIFACVRNCNKEYFYCIFSAL